MQTFAAIDIGSNSCRLKIARVVNHRLKLIHEDREVTRLGASVFETGLVSPDAMANTLRALKRFQRAIQANGVDKVRVVATAAMRDARNAQAFVAWAKAETGWDVEIISGLEEGRLIHRGVMGTEQGVGGRVILIDVGGGSCEITLSVKQKMVETISLPIGAVRLTQEFLPDDPPTEEDVHRLHQFISRELRRAHRRIQPSRISLVIATSGTAAALCDSGRAIAKPSDREGIAKSKVGITSTRSVRRIANKLVKLRNEERAAIPGIGPRRSEIIIAGALVYAQLLESFGLPGFRYSDLGLRDGVLAQMLAEQDSRTSEHKKFEQERWDSVLATCRRYGVDPKQAEPFRYHAAQLFRELESLHKLPAEYLTWIESAAMLRDIGKFLNHQGHHRHTQYIVAACEIFGFTRQQRTIVSAIARYMGKTRPQPTDRAMRNIPPEEHENVKKAIVLLRLAVALNQDRASDVLKVKSSVYPKRVLMQLSPGSTGAELELWSLRKEADYFREVFRRELFVALR
jgi:exopolyphosphatase/guanosine-5'-triphosphate,3'-diphosphate pyrophosphatase